MCYRRLLATLYDPFMTYFEAAFLRAERADLLRDLRGRVLEIGAGTGANFPHYPAEAQVWAVEPSGPMLTRARRRIPSGQSIKLIQAGIEDIELDFPPGHFDAIVCTLVLCTVPDPAGALARCRQWLRPGGELRVLEHIRSPHSRRARWQDRLTPAWRCLADGCHLNRPTDQWLRTAGFQAEAETYTLRGVTWYRARLKPPLS